MHNGLCNAVNAGNVLAYTISRKDLCPFVLIDSVSDSGMIFGLTLLSGFHRPPTLCVHPSDLLFPSLSLYLYYTAMFGHLSRFGQDNVP